MSVDLVSEADDDGPIAAWRAAWSRRYAELADDPAGRLARHHGFVVAWSELVALGWRRHDLRRELRRGTWWLPARGVASPVVVHGDGHAAVRIRHAVAGAAAVLNSPNRVPSARTAAIVHGLPTMRVPDRPELTLVGVGTLGRHGGTHAFGAKIAPKDVTNWFGSDVATVARTIVDLARHDRFDGVMAADAALRESLVSAHELKTVLDDAVGWPGVRQAREIVALADPRAESPLESITRLRLHDDQFPDARPQLVVPDPERGRAYRVDLALDDGRLIIEADGRGKYEGDALWEERQREGRLRALGYRVERVVWADVTTFWPETARRLRAALLNN